MDEAINPKTRLRVMGASVNPEDSIFLLFPPNCLWVFLWYGWPHMPKLSLPRYF